jgi:wyosine [tRNA(Phe)-imidazoG37] synthetase (radical SAM superfamily)
MIVFGPVPSRRLGRSLGINNIPPKVCSYSCIYCQVGRTMNLQANRQVFYNPPDIFQAVQAMIEKAWEAGEPIDYLTFVPDGEPTLDLNLGKEIELLKKLGIRIAVITNASLIWDPGVREDLFPADWVSLKVDSLREDMWRKINRPHRTLKLSAILEGMFDFAAAFQGCLVTETMLVQGLNVSEEDCEKTAGFLTQLKPAMSYLSIPIRPPAEKWVRFPSVATLNQTYQIFKSKLIHVELLTGYEGDSFSFMENAEESLLSITSVHPMREDAVREFLSKSDSDWSMIDKLIAQGKLIETLYEGEKYYLRKLY